MRQTEQHEFGYLEQPITVSESAEALAICLVVAGF